MKLTPEEQQILNGEQGETLAKIMKSVVRYGEIFGADRLVPVTKPGHLVTSFGVSMLKPVYDLMDELIANGIKTKLPFTVDPRPLDHKNIKYTLPEKLVFKFMYGKQNFYENQLKQVGLKDDNAFTCACYHENVGNTPEERDVLAWSESSAVVYANSVIGARTNRNSAIIDLFCGILGKAPEFDLLTNEGRKAKWLVDVDTSELPVPQVLGSAIGIKVVEDVPFIRGLNKYFKHMSADDVRDYLKELGAAAASNGAVGLFHVEGVTPEAIDLGEKLVLEDVETYTISDEELKRVKDSYEVLWKNKDAKSTDVFCWLSTPFDEPTSYMDKQYFRIVAEKWAKKLKIKTVLTAAPDDVEAFKTDTAQYEKLMATGARLSSVCPLMNMNNPLFVGKRVITNSNKLRTYSTARYCSDNEILTQITGEL